MRLLLALILICAPSAKAFAEDFTATRTWEELDKIDAARPLRSAKYKDAKDMLSARILDETNRVIGEVDDIILDRNGAITQLTVDFDRLRLGIGPLNINYNDMRTRKATNGFKLGYSNNEIRARVPQILADMETASGENEDTYSLKKLIGQPIYNTKSAKLGEIEEILFDQVSGRAKFMALKLSEKSVRGKTALIPFSEARYQDAKLTVSNNFSNILLAYIQAK
ncbi:MAG: PRC-barrel domain-containing protein [Rhodospirillales bacterium]|nr:PRC-barrel domain-containing protein [Rhodospirillales bacterium]